MLGNGRIYPDKAGHNETGLCLGRIVTIWADDRAIHVLSAGNCCAPGRPGLRPSTWPTLALKGARPAGPEPGHSAIPHGPLPVVEIDCTANRDDEITLAGQRIPIAAPLPGNRSRCASTGT